MEQNKTKRTDVNELGEFGLIDHLTSEVVLKQPTSIKGIGDDAAVIDSGDHYTLVSTDMLVEGIHFDMAYTPLKHLGYKAVIVNISDIYAMNGVPQQITVSIALSNRFSVEALEELYAGINLACDLYNVDLVGGDTTSSPKGLIISITAIGVCEKPSLVLRSGARVGDIICLTGSIGEAYLGLQILEKEKAVYVESVDIQPELSKHEFMIGRLLKPEARKDAIAFFEEKDIIPTSMIDVSDGLASELFHIARQSQVGIVVEESLIPMHPDAKLLALDFKMNPITCSLNGGEDYELLFTVSENKLDEVRYMQDVSIIGTVVDPKNGVLLKSEAGKFHPLQAQGWNHFNS